MRRILETLNLAKVGRTRRVNSAWCGC